VALVDAVARAATQAVAEDAGVRMDRRRAFTALVRRYEQVRRAVLFVRSAEGDANAWIPPLRTGRGGRRR
jgi:hypothetical protein